MNRTNWKNELSSINNMGLSTPALVISAILAFLSVLIVYAVKSVMWVGKLIVGTAIFVLMSPFLIIGGIVQLFKGKV